MKQIVKAAIVGLAIVPCSGEKLLEIPVKRREVRKEQLDNE